MGQVGRTWDGVRAKGVEAGWLGARMGGRVVSLMGGAIRGSIEWKDIDAMSSLGIGVQRRDDVIHIE